MIKLHLIPIFGIVTQIQIRVERNTQKLCSRNSIDLLTCVTIEQLEFHLNDPSEVHSLGF
jgi:hypothetical protein